MNKARTLGPVLMILVGIALVATPARSAVDVGTVAPCTTLQQCEPDPCDDIVTVAFVDPCLPPATRPEPTTTTADVTTTTAAVTTTTAGVTTTTGTGPSTTATSAPVTTAAPSTSAPSGVGAAGGGRPPTASRGGALARTGSNAGPLTAGGIALAGLGVVLLVSQRRRAAA